jgi:hypothetical protein
LQYQCPLSYHLTIFEYLTFFISFDLLFTCMCLCTSHHVFAIAVSLLFYCLVFPLLLCLLICTLDFIFFKLMYFYCHLIS